MNILSKCFVLQGKMSKRLIFAIFEELVFCDKKFRSPAILIKIFAIHFVKMQKIAQEEFLRPMACPLCSCIWRPKHTFLLVVVQLESHGNPKSLSLFVKIFHPSVCTWSLSSTMTRTRGGNYPPPLCNCYAKVRN